MAFPATPKTPDAILKTQLIDFFQDHGIQTHRLVEVVWTPQYLELTYLAADENNKLIQDPRTGDIVYTTHRVEVT